MARGGQHCRGGTGVRRLHEVDTEKRVIVLDTLRTELAQEDDIVFAYLYGSFLDGVGFHDVDVGVYRGPGLSDSHSLRAGELSECLSARVEIPVDVRIVNEAPISFLYHVLRGMLLFSRDDVRLAEMIEDTTRRYLDIAPLLRHSTKEAFAS